jgi:hypothetical protein
MLIQRERASVPLRYRVRGAESFALRVVALRGDEAGDALALGDDIEAGDERSLSILCGLAAACVYVGNEPAFGSVANVRRLSSGEVAELCADVLRALSQCSPLYAVSDATQWHAVLKNGAMHHRNYTMAARVASCVDVVGGFQKAYRHQRPDRWFGLPTCELTDGQLMAYDAARSVFEKD